MSLVPIFLVDAFCDKAPFSGNPAGVCLLTAPADPEWMQAVAMEMNQAETAFLWPIEGGFSLRWFTPTVEVDLCGHATLASSQVLFEQGLSEARFFTKSGWLAAKKCGDLISLDFPAEVPDSVQGFPDIEAGIGFPPISIYRNRMDWLALVEDETAVRNLVPKMSCIKALGMRGLIVTAQSSSPEIDFVSRFFAPQSGVPEDHATGSAHCALAPFWAPRLMKTKMRALQLSPRGAYFEVELDGDRVVLTGKARTTLTGQLKG